MKKSIEKILVDIIQHELDLPDNYGTTKKGDVIPSIIIFAQNIKLFNTDKMQITVKTVSSRDYSNRITYKDNPNPQQEDGSDAFLSVQDINQWRMIQIDVYSRNNEARERFWEVTAALKSVYAAQMQDLYNFKLGQISNDTNTSGLDGGSDINRFTITFEALIHHQKTKPVSYYDKFSTDVYDEHNLIFNIQR